MLQNCPVNIIRVALRFANGTLPLKLIPAQCKNAVQSLLVILSKVSHNKTQGILGKHVTYWQLHTSANIQDKDK
jgi:hypothetical protein